MQEQPAHRRRTPVDRDRNAGGALELGVHRRRDPQAVTVERRDPSRSGRGTESRSVDREPGGADVLAVPARAAGPPRWMVWENPRARTAAGRRWCRSRPTAASGPARAAVTPMTTARKADASHRRGRRRLWTGPRGRVRWCRPVIQRRNHRAAARAARQRTGLRGCVAVDRRDRCERVARARCRDRRTGFRGRTPTPLRPRRRRTRAGARDRSPSAIAGCLRDRLVIYERQRRRDRCPWPAETGRHRRSAGIRGRAVPLRDAGSAKRCRRQATGTSNAWPAKKSKRQGDQCSAGGSGPSAYAHHVRVAFDSGQQCSTGSRCSADHAARFPSIEVHRLFVAAYPPPGGVRESAAASPGGGRPSRTLDRPGTTAPHAAVHRRDRCTPTRKRFRVR